MPEIIQAATKEDYRAAASLFREYAVWLNIDLGFQGFEEELQQLNSIYTPTRGGILLMKENGLFIGCIAVRKIDETTGELKRMYVQPAHQHKGHGTTLLLAVIELAKKHSYTKLRLDTLANMLPAIALYKKHGFYEIPAYYFNPEPNAVYFEKQL